MVGIIGHFLFIRHLSIVFSDKTWIFPGLFKLCLIIKNYLRAFAGFLSFFFFSCFEW